MRGWSYNVLYVYRRTTNDNDDDDDDLGKFSMLAGEKAQCHYSFIATASLFLIF